MATKRFAAGRMLILTPALFLTILPLLCADHRHGDDAPGAASRCSHGDCSRFVRWRGAFSAASVPVHASPDGDDAPGSDHSSDTCAICQALVQLAAIEICVPSPYLHSLTRPELRSARPERITVALRHSRAILPRAPPIPA